MPTKPERALLLLLLLLPTPAAARHLHPWVKQGTLMQLHLRLPRWRGAGGGECSGRG